MSMNYKKRSNLKGKTPAEVRQELREIIYESRRQKIIKRAAETSKKVVDFSWDAVKSFVSDVKFKKEVPSEKKELNNVQPAIKQPHFSEEKEKISFYDRWYNMVSEKK